MSAVLVTGPSIMQNLVFSSLVIAIGQSPVLCAYL